MNEKAYTGYGSELDGKIYSKLESIETRLDESNGHNHDHSSENNYNQKGEYDMLTTTSNIVPTVADGGYFGYGKTGLLLDKIAFDQNQQIQRDILLNNSEIKQSELGLKGDITRGVCELNNNNTMRQLEANMLNNSNFSNQTAMINGRFNSAEVNNNSRFTSLDNKIDNLERDLLQQKIADLRDDKILAGQRAERLEAERNAFCCPKPSARYEVVGCQQPCPQPQNGGGVTVNEVVNVVNTMLANRGIMGNG